MSPGNLMPFAGFIALPPGIQVSVDQIGSQTIQPQLVAPIRERPQLLDRSGARHGSPKASQRFRLLDRLASGGNDGTDLLDGRALRIVEQVCVSVCCCWIRMT